MFSRQYSVAVIEGYFSLNFSWISSTISELLNGLLKADACVAVGNFIAKIRSTLFGTSKLFVAAFAPLLRVLFGNPLKLSNQCKRVYKVVCFRSRFL
jgi:hypothetical protein